MTTNLTHLNAAGTLMDFSDANLADEALRAAKVNEAHLQVRARESKAAKEDGRVLSYVASDETPDRVGDVIKVSGWDLSTYKQNPVVLWGHDGNVPPIGRTINVRRGERNGRRALLASVEFAPAEAHPFADTVYQLAKAGFVNAVSVGFMPMETKELADKQREKLGMPKYGVYYSKASLLELSLVSVPANPSALAVGAKGLVDRGILKSAAVDRFLKEVPLTQEQVTESLRSRIRSFVDLGAATVREAVTEVEEKSPACRMDGESEAECVARKIPELMEEEGMGQDQAVAVASEVCETPCDESKAVEPGTHTADMQKVATMLEGAAKILRSYLDDDEDDEDDEKTAPDAAPDAGVLDTVRDDSYTRLVDAQAEQVRATASLVDSISDLTARLRDMSEDAGGEARSYAPTPEACPSDAVSHDAPRTESLEEATREFLDRLTRLR